MKLSVNPVRVEIYDEEMKHFVATVDMNDDVTCKVQVLQVVGWHDWLDLTDAVRRAMHMMGMQPLDEGGKPHGH
jgi:hypothetical protein